MTYAIPNVNALIFLNFWQVLDADNGRRLESFTGRVATRDIVQFVPLREVHSEYIMTLVCLEKAFVITSKSIHKLWADFCGLGSIGRATWKILTYMRGRDIKTRPLHVAPMST
uniref:Uncharacterized protein n=1 Tax=Quercus lobata TaxID=97700 RepID=A0A7N2L491_QUELO